MALTADQRAAQYPSTPETRALSAAEQLGADHIYSHPTHIAEGLARTVSEWAATDQARTAAAA